MPILYTTTGKSAGMNPAHPKRCRSLTEAQPNTLNFLALTPKHTAPLVTHSCFLLIVSHYSIYSLYTIDERLQGQSTAVKLFLILLSSY